MIPPPTTHLHTPPFQGPICRSEKRRRWTWSPAPPRSPRGRGGGGARRNSSAQRSAAMSRQERPRTPKTKFAWYQIRCHTEHGPATQRHTLGTTSARLSTKGNSPTGLPGGTARRCHCSLGLPQARPFVSPALPHFGAFVLVLVLVVPIAGSWHSSPAAAVVPCVQGPVESVAHEHRLLLVVVARWGRTAPNVLHRSVCTQKGVGLAC